MWRRPSTLLRKQGMATAAKKAGRHAGEGVVGSYIHAGGKIGVLVEINCETDFVARTDDFQELVKDVAMHVAAADPRFVQRDEVTPEILAQEREIYKEQALASGKPENIVDRIVEGKMEKFYAESVLLEQPFIKDTDTDGRAVGGGKDRQIGREYPGAKIRSVPGE